MVFRRMTAGLALAGLALLALATPAFAHAQLQASNPAKGSTLDTAPKLVQLTFNEAVSPISITVAGPQGTKWAVGQIVVAGPTVSAPVTAVGPAGAYVVTYTVKSDDGDDVTGTIDFTMAVAAVAAETTTTAAPTTTSATTQAPPTTTSAAAAADTGGGGMPGWAWLVIALLVALLVVAAFLVWARSRSGEQDEVNIDGPPDQSGPSGPSGP